MESPNTLVAVDIGIDTHQEPVVYMRSDCHICRSEGFIANSGVLVDDDNSQIITTINVVDEKVLKPGSAGLSNIAMQRLGAAAEAPISVNHAPVVTSLRTVRKKYLDASSVTKIYQRLLRTSERIDILI